MKLIIYTDGGSRTNSAAEPGPASCAFVAFDEQHKYIACMNETLIGPNNVAEYRGLLLAVNSLDRMLDFSPSDVDRIEFRADSQLLVNQMAGNWRCRDKNLIELQASDSRDPDPLFRHCHFVCVVSAGREQRSRLPLQPCPRRHHHRQHVRAVACQDQGQRYLRWPAVSRGPSYRSQTSSCRPRGLCPLWLLQSSSHQLQVPAT